MKTNAIIDIIGPESAYISSGKPSEDDLIWLSNESGVLRDGGITRLSIKTNNGVLYISVSQGRVIIRFPHNCNAYKRDFAKHTGRITAEWICKEWDHLSWTDFHYTPPQDYFGNDPKTLDELCVFFKNLRHKRRVSRLEKEFVINRFLELMYEEAKVFAEKLNMPFHSLRLLSIGSLSKIANTDGHGTITYNVNRMYQDADTIRQVLVHELCHSIRSDHGNEFSKVMEESMISLGLISRPCSYSTYLDMSDKTSGAILPDGSGARFPTGKYCPGYNFFTFIKGEFDNRFLPKTSLWKRDGLISTP